MRGASCSLVLTCDKEPRGIGSARGREGPRFALTLSRSAVYTLREGLVRFPVIEYAMHRVIAFLVLGALSSLSATAVADETTYEVQPGDILGAIAERHGCRIADLRAANPRMDPDRLQVGQQLTIPDCAAQDDSVYTVVAGDTLMGIAARHGCRTADLQRANPRVDPARLQIGQRLQIPECARTPSSGGSGRTDQYTVQYGDTMMGIAERLGVSYSALRGANPDVNPDRLQIGEELRVPAARSGQGSGNVHVVRPGDTLSAIAAQYAVSLDDLTAWNRGLNPNRLQVGQEIRLRTSRPVREIVYEVEAGDFLGSIAERYSVTTSELVSWNRGLDPDRIRVGQEIRIFQEGPEVRSESQGSASDGRLINGEQLPPHAGYNVRSSRRAWATNETVTSLMAGFDHVRRRYPNVPSLAVHDLSYENGGPMEPHLSHQSGRDADIGYYHEDCTDSCVYRAVRASELTPRYNWELFRYWIDNGLVEYIFVDYTLQERLYEYARSQGVSERTLERIFQYPRGRHSGRGIIRHEPGHRTHFHVRFSCSSDDSRCY